MDAAFRYSPGKLNGRPLRDTFALVGRTLRVEAIPQAEDVLDGMLEPRKAGDSVLWGHQPGEASGVPDAVRKTWETTTPERVLASLDERYVEGAEGEAFERNVPRLRIGLRAEPDAPYVLLVAKADIDPSSLPQDDTLSRRLESLCNALRLIVDSVRRDVGVWEPPQQNPFSLFSQDHPFALVHGLVEFDKEEFSELRETFNKVRRGDGVSSTEYEKLLRQLRDEVGFRPLGSADLYSSHVISGGNVAYQVGLLKSRIGHPSMALYSLRLEWESSTGATSRTDAEPGGWIGHPPSRASRAAAPQSLVSLLGIVDWHRKLVDRTGAVLQELDAIRDEFENQQPRGIDALDRVSELGYKLSRLRRDAGWTLYKDLPHIRELGEDSKLESEVGLIPPWWPEDRPWEGQDTRFIKQLSEEVLALIEHQQEIAEEATRQLELLGQQAEGRVSAHYADEMERHSLWTKRLTFILVGLTIVLIFLTFVLVA